jgi:pimeloyl-ACP methyl ester carboxylesterase
MNIKQEGVGVQGDEVRFAQYGHFATRLLELLREGQHGPMPQDEQEEQTEDHIIGRYIFIDAPVWGRTKTFVETSGDGPTPIVFLHTAGSDSRQYHGVMNDKRIRKKCTMYAFDLPAHGRSFPGSNHIPGNHTNNEEAYVGTIREVVKTLKLEKPIICGASMAGQVCVAVAIRADEVGAGGTIPLQGCDYCEFYTSCTLHAQVPAYELQLAATPDVRCLRTPFTPFTYQFEAFADLYLTTSDHGSTVQRQEPGRQPELVQP